MKDEAKFDCVMDGRLTASRRYGEFFIGLDKVSRHEKYDLLFKDLNSRFRFRLEDCSVAEIPGRRHGELTFINVCYRFLKLVALLFTRVGCDASKPRFSRAMQ
ncbi:hypothetical protein AAMO2058_000166200 [Amorphochlora amoebiformis]|eukprot:1364522-Amorphochlora_amoeboformis.AAC.1